MDKSERGKSTQIVSQPNPESILLYKELLEHIQKMCHEMRKDQIIALRVFFYEDKEEEQDNILWHFRLGYWQAIVIRTHALKKIRDHLADVGIIERRKGMIPKKPIRKRYIMNLSEFWQF